MNKQELLKGAEVAAKQLCIELGLDPSDHQSATSVVAESMTMVFNSWWKQAEQHGVDPANYVSKMYQNRRHGLLDILKDHLSNIAMLVEWCDV